MQSHKISKKLLFLSFLAMPLSIQAAGPHWEYDEQASWGSILDDTVQNPVPYPYPYATCNLGTKQSPLNLATQMDLSDVPLVVSQNSLKFAYSDIPVNVENNGHTLKVNTPAGGASNLAIGQDHYSLLQYHFHSPSEHQLQGHSYPLEIHFVHGTQDGKMAVVGVFFKRGKHNPGLQAVLDNAPLTVGTVTALTDKTLNPSALLPKKQIEFFTYAGSLTTPPCTEGINWYVLKNPVEASHQQIDQFQSFYSDNARSPQSANGRQVIRR